MYFLLQSEVQKVDPVNGHPLKKIYCPSCGKSQIYLIDKKELYTKYKCWNKECEMKDEHFVVINDFIKEENNFNLYCENCDQPYSRIFEKTDYGYYRLIFNCDGKLCGMYDNPYIYDLKSGKWIGNMPEFRVYEDEISFRESEVKTSRSGNQIIEKGKDTPISISHSEFKSKVKPSVESSIENEILTHGLDMPLLTMQSDEYQKFLEEHNGKIVVLIDVPNFLRTLHHYYPNRFERILKKAHLLLLKFIADYFSGQNEYIIRYFSKPDEDLASSNAILASCAQKKSGEFFHMLRIEKYKGYSDIDNYLIANAVEILERCEIKGFVIVSSDKDYLPVMRIADYRGVKSCMIGINTSDIYEHYNIGDIKFLSILKYTKF
ncbi:MAG: NYN domain-containing protein [Promethearchaeota archaeon]|nr:MAG: NYN domain-containing protein [Candidatus Lokiarchaeota archaeon]